MIPPGTKPLELFAEFPQGGHMVEEQGRICQVFQARKHNSTSSQDWLRFLDDEPWRVTEAPTQRSIYLSLQRFHLIQNYKPSQNLDDLPLGSRLRTRHIYAVL